MKRGRLPLLLGMLLLTVTSLGSAQETSPIADAPFLQEYHEAYPFSSPGANDVRALALDSAGRLWAATGEGVHYLDNKTWKTPSGGMLGPTHALYRDAQGTLWVGAWNGLYTVGTGGVKPTPIQGTPIGVLGGSGSPSDGNSSAETLFAGGPHGIWRRTQDGWTKIQGRWNTALHALLPASGNRLWIGCNSGLYLQELTGGDPRSTRFSKPNVLLSSSIRALTTLPDGEMCIGSTGGLDFYRDTKRVRSLTTKDGMPFREARAVARDIKGRLWIATPSGVIRENGAGANPRWNLRHSRRWLSSDDTRDVEIAADGTVWVATAAGVDAIRSRSMTLEEKADYFLKLLRARHIRPPGLIGPAVLETPGDLTRSFIEDDDNDGEHTGMYCAMESMRYAVTKAPDARANAKAAFHALMVLQKATGTPHFIARSVLPLGTAPRHEVDRTFTAEEIADSHRTEPREKIIEKRWIPTADGKWLWKRDASSDEVDGHMFGYSVYYDLAADEDEKRLVADQVDRLIGGLIDHGYLLQDIDGKGTRWGNWSPLSLNGDPNWYEERAGNSVEMLSYLGVVYHMTHKTRYLAAARELIDKHGYDRNMLQTSFDTASERTHIEDELLSIVYPNLMTHLLFPSLKTNAEISMQRWHRTAVQDGIPFYDFVFNRFSGRRVPLTRAVETLRDWPLDMIEWTVDNSRREDVVKDTTPGLDGDRLTRILPRSEMGICMWDQEPYRAIIGLNGAREDKPTDWLLAYWMGRYYGLLAGPAER